MILYSNRVYNMADDMTEKEPQNSGESTKQPQEFGPQPFQFEPAGGPSSGFNQLDARLGGGAQRIPGGVGGFPPVSGEQPKGEHKPHWGRRIALGAASLLTAAGIGYGIDKGMNSSGDDDPNKGVAASVPSTPEEPTTTPTVEATPTATKEVPPTPTKTAKEIAFEKMPAPVKVFYGEIEGLNNTVFKGTEMTPEIVERDILQLIEKIQTVTSENPTFEANRDFNGYLGILSVLQAQYYGRDRSLEIQKVAQNIVRFLQGAYPEQYNAYTTQTNGFEPAFIPPIVK